VLKAVRTASRPTAGRPANWARSGPCWTMWRSPARLALLEGGWALRQRGRQRRHPLNCWRAWPRVPQPQRRWRQSPRRRSDAAA